MNLIRLFYNFFSKYIVFFFFFTFLTTIYFGLRVKDFNFINNISKVSNPDRIKFSKYSIGYCGPINKGFKVPFTLELAFKASGSSFNGGFKSILMFSNGSDESQFIIGQWRDWIIIMNGCDYSNRLKKPRISFKLPEKNKIFFLTIISHQNGVKLFLDGKLIKNKSSLILEIPKAKDLWLVFGNNLYANAPWEGIIYGFGLFDRILSKKEIKKHYNIWKEKGSFLFKKYRPVILFNFDEVSGDRIKNSGSCLCALKLPYFLHVLKPQRLFGVKTSSDKNYNLWDKVINLLGFIPLGFFTIFLLNYRFSFSLSGNVIAALFFCMAISFFIEIAQTFLPSRCSDFSDIVFNSLGAGLGIIIFLVSSKIKTLNKI